MNEPDQSVINEMKTKYPDRDIALFSLSDEYGDYHFIMTAPDNGDWTKYQREIDQAGKSEEKLQKVVYTAALAQIRWPSRDETKAIFDRRPGLVQNILPQLQSLAGVNATARLKKL